MEHEPATVKVSLESFGLTLSNVPPYFAPDSQGTENDGASSLHDGFVYISDVGSKDSGSIVVLGNTSLDVLQTQTLAEYEEILQKSMSIDSKALTANLSATEIDIMLKEVLQQNFRFKEVLGHTILTTKKALNIIASKQEEVSKVHEEHKRQFAETKILVNVLRAENNEYKMKIDELNRETANRSMQTEAQNDESTGSMAQNEKAGESEVTKLMEQCEKQDQEITRMRKVIASLEQRLELDRKEREKFFRVHEEQKRKFAETEKLVNGLRTEADEYRMKMEELNKESTNRSIQTESQKDENAASMVQAGESEVTKLVGKCEKQGEEITRMRTVITHLEQQLELANENVESTHLEHVQSLLENMRRSREQIMYDLERERAEMALERARFQEDERKLVEVNVSLHEQMATIRESNEVLRAQLAVFKTDWLEQRQLCVTMRKKEDELLGLVEKLEDEKNQLVETMRYLENNPNA